jgi:hypothetical protein
MAWALSSILCWIVIGDAAAQALPKSNLLSFSDVAEVAKIPCARNDAIMIRKEGQSVAKSRFLVLRASALKTLGFDTIGVEPELSDCAIPFVPRIVDFEGTKKRLGKVNPAFLSGSRLVTLPNVGTKAAEAPWVALWQPTKRYRHFVLGSREEAAALRFEEPACSGGKSEIVCGTKLAALVDAGDDAVFEDRLPRLAKLDDGEKWQVIVVKSYLDKGAALAVVGKRDGRWQILAETPPVGQANRWLNPAAVADFDGDGAKRIALVKTPHLAGILQVWRWERREGGKPRLVLEHEKPGYSNHVIGSPMLELATTITLDGHAGPLLAIPTLDRASLAILALKGGIAELKRIPLPGRVKTGVAALGSGHDTHILVGLDDGRVVLVRP